MIEIQKALQELIMAADPRTNMSDVVLIDALSRARNAVNMWIDIKEKKPEDRQSCIYWHSKHTCVCLGTYYAEHSCFDSEVFACEDATHWMPEPEGPDG